MTYDITDYTKKVPNLPIEVEEVDTVIKDKFEANYLNVRRRGLRSRRTWTMNWSDNNLIDSSNFNSTRDLLISLRGTFFDLVHPFTGEEIKVTVESFSYAEKMYSKDHGVFYSLNIKLLEK